MKWLHRLERLIGHTGNRMHAIANFLYYFRIGLEYGYPVCCVIHFSWDTIRGNPPALRRGGIHKPGEEKVYVPCIFHYLLGHSDWEPFYGRHRSQLQLFKSPQTKKANSAFETHADIRRHRRKKARA